MFKQYHWLDHICESFALNGFPFHFYKLASTNLAFVDNRYLENVRWRHCIYGGVSKGQSHSVTLSHTHSHSFCSGYFVVVVRSLVRSLQQLQAFGLRLSTQTSDIHQQTTRRPRPDDQTTRRPDDHTVSQCS